MGYVHLPAFFGIALTSALAAPLGVATVHRLPPKLVKRLFGRIPDPGRLADACWVLVKEPLITLHGRSVQCDQGFPTSFAATLR